MEESGTKLHIPLVLKHFVLFPQKLSVCGRVFVYLSVNEKITNIAARTVMELDMKNKELITELANRMDWTSKEVSDMLSALSSVVSSKLVDNDTIYLQGFGQFEVKKKAERISVNPANGKRYLVPPKLVPVFKPGTTVKNRLKELGDHE